jgi:signal transduction histidine kinase
VPWLPRSSGELIGWVRARPLAADTLLAVGCLGALMIVWVASPPIASPGPLGSSMLWAALGLAPVAVRRRWLWLAVLLSVGANLTTALADRASGAESLGLDIVAYTVAASAPPLRALLGTAVLWLPPVTMVVAWPELFPDLKALGPTYIVTVNGLMALVVFFIGRTVYTRRRYVTALEGRAEAAEANQRALAAQAVGDERRRIARELHDVVAHHVSVMGVLATGARRTGRRDPAAADAALAAIEETGRSAMRELRRLLDVLRTEEEPPELTPQPGLAGVHALVEQIRDTGLPVSLEIDGEPPDLDPGVALAVYRIVQEALTNTIKHAGPARAAVRLTCDPDALAVDVTDDGRGPVSAPSGVGHGLVGIRERVALYGGELRTGPRLGGGYRVYAKIPVENHWEAR